jgi:hypothetical protein
VDTSISSSPDVSYYNTIGAGLDRADNEVIYLQVPALASAGPITVETAGGTSAAVPISLSQLQGIAMSGVPPNPAQPSANPGQTIQVVGNSLDYTTEVIFPVIDVAGTLSNRAATPSFVSVAGTLMEVRVPDDAITGNVRVVGAAGSFPLQVVPTLALAERIAGSSLRLLGGGLTENSSLTVTVGGTPIADTGTNVDVLTSFLAADTLVLTTALSATVSVTTAGGTSASVTIPVSDPPTVTNIYGLAIFPATAGEDAGRLVVVDSTGDALRVLNPATLETLRTLTRPTQDHAGSGPRIDRAEQDPFGILTGDLDLGLLPTQRPGVA